MDELIFSMQFTQIKSQTFSFRTQFISNVACYGRTSDIIVYNWSVCQFRTFFWNVVMITALLHPKMSKVRMNMSARATKMRIQAMGNQPLQHTIPRNILVDRMCLIGKDVAPSSSSRFSMSSIWCARSDICTNTMHISMVKYTRIDMEFERFSTSLYRFNWLKSRFIYHRRISFSILSQLN